MFNSIARAGSHGVLSTHVKEGATAGHAWRARARHMTPAAGTAERNGTHGAVQGRGCSDAQPFSHSYPAMGSSLSSNELRAHTSHGSPGCARVCCRWRQARAARQWLTARRPQGLTVARARRTARTARPAAPPRLARAWRRCRSARPATDWPRCRPARPRCASGRSRPAGPSACIAARPCCCPPRRAAVTEYTQS